MSSVGSKVDDSVYSFCKALKFSRPTRKGHSTPALKRYAAILTCEECASVFVKKSIKSR